MIYPRIHGHPVIGMLRLPDREGLRKNLHVILVHRGSAYRGHGEYVTALWCDGDKEWMNGHYFNTFAEGAADFAERCDKNTPKEEIHNAYTP